MLDFGAAVRSFTGRVTRPQLTIPNPSPAFKPRDARIHLA
jgi:hypothetical protein